MRAAVVTLIALLSASAMACGYLAPSAALFAGGLAALAAALGPLTLWAGRGRWREGVLATGLALSALCLLLLCLEAGARLLSAGERPGSPAAVYSYDAAHGDPQAFRRWWLRYLAEWTRSMHSFSRRDPQGLVPQLLVPGRHGRFFDSVVRVNRLGFRGPEIALDKGDHYRIVVLGTSTTFGATLARSDEPWPEKLERRIATQLSCDAPVEVVNAGGVAYRLEHNLARLERDIFPLAPDLIVSYHNHAGFREARGLRTLPEDAHAPVVPPRGSLLVRRAEQILRLALYRGRAEASRRELESPQIDERALAARLASTELARDYRSLVQRVRARGIGIVLCTHPLAVNAESPDDVVRFYEAGFPDVRAAIALNRLHTRLVEQIGRELGVQVIDTTPGLDGAWRDAYIDLVHYTEKGRERLAQRVFEGLRERLAEDPRLHCRPRTVGTDRAGSEPVRASR